MITIQVLERQRQEDRGDQEKPGSSKPQKLQNEAFTKGSNQKNPPVMKAVTLKTQVFSKRVACSNLQRGKQQLYQAYFCAHFKWGSASSSFLGSS